MQLPFVKMNGAGNDFLVLDNRARKIKLTPDDVARLCDRHRGIGADGVILLVPCASGKADWAWEFFNSDGSVANMCGNGARCFARFVQKLTGLQGGFTFETGAGLITTAFEGGRHEQRIRMIEAPSGSSGSAFCTVKSSPFTLVLKIES